MRGEEVGARWIAGTGTLAFKTVRKSPADLSIFARMRMRKVRRVKSFPRKPIQPLARVEKRLSSRPHRSSRWRIFHDLGFLAAPFVSRRLKNHLPIPLLLLLLLLPPWLPYHHRHPPLARDERIDLRKPSPLDRDKFFTSFFHRPSSLFPTTSNARVTHAAAWQKEARPADSKRRGKKENTSSSNSSSRKRRGRNRKGKERGRLDSQGWKQKEKGKEGW